MIFKATFYFSLITIISSHAFANCNKKIDPKKVILFIDTNKSDLEIEVAEKAACTRGETLVIIPKDYKDYSNISRQISALSAKNKGCSTNLKFASENCPKEVYEKINQLNDELIQLRSKNENFSELIKKELNQLKASGAKIKNVTISGHDGGGIFGGEKTSFSRLELAQILDKFPEVNEVQSIHLLGCYTGVKNEVINWSQIFPDVRLIGGYDASAPASEKPAGHQYLKDLLEKEKKLISVADEKKILSNLKLNLNSLHNLNAGIYIKPICQATPEENGYLYATMGGSSITKIKISDECMLKNKELKDLRIAIEEYSSGEKEPPLNSSTGPLRDLYNQMRKNEHCSNLGVNPKVVFGLLFNDGMKKNFGAYYKKELDELANYIENYSEKDVNSINEINKKMITSQEDALKIAEKRFELLNKNPELLKKEIEKEFEQSIQSYNHLINTDPEVKKFAEANDIDQITGKEVPETNIIALFSPNNTQNIAQLIGIRVSLLSQKATLEAVQKNDIKQLRTLVEDTLKNTKSTFAYFSQYTRPAPSVEEMKKIWIPTSENLAKKTRKEMLQNSHALSGLLSSRSFLAQTANSLSRTASLIDSHLIHYNNPFSWHEYTGGTIEAPPTNGMQGYFYGMGLNVNNIEGMGEIRIGF